MFADIESQQDMELTIPEKFTFRLSPGSVMSGRVLDESGKPIAGVKVEIDYAYRHFKPENFVVPSIWDSQTTTDADARKSCSCWKTKAMMTPKDLLDTMLGYLGFVVQIEETMNEGGNATLQIYTEESRRLIGRNGETLEAIQFLLNRLLQARDKDAEKVIVDCEHYRSMREDRIVQRVRELADRVRITGRALQLEPMNSYERRLVHNAFKDDPDVATWSPSDSARIKQITLIKRQPRRETASQRKAIS
jgi:spoIIIJ-associated protein